MKRRLKWASFFLAACLPLIFLGWFSQKTFREKRAIAEIREALKTVIDMKEFHQTLTFQKALQLIEAKCASKGKRLPIVLDYQAFKKDAEMQDFRKDVEGPGLFDIEIKFPLHPKKMSAGIALRLVLCKINPPVAYGATYVIRPDGVIITPRSKEQQEAVRMGRLRVYPVSGLVIPIKEPGFWERMRKKFSDFLEPESGIVG